MVDASDFVDPSGFSVCTTYTGLVMGPGYKVKAKDSFKPWIIFHRVRQGELARRAIPMEDECTSSIPCGIDSG